MILTGAPLVVDRAVVEAVSAAQARTPAAFGRACDRLVALDAHHVRRLLQAVLRPALEDRHPDGVDGDDLAALLAAVTAWGPARECLPSLDPLALAVVITGAFGIAVAERDDLPHPIADDDLIRHAVVVVAHVAGPAPALRRRLDHAWAEIARADQQD